MILRIICFITVMILLFASIVSDNTAYTHLQAFLVSPDLKDLSIMGYFALRSIGCVIMALIFMLFMVLGSLDASKKSADKESEAKTCEEN